MEWRQRFLGFSLACGAIYIVFALPYVIYDIVVTLNSFMLMSPPSWWSYIRENEALVGTITHLLRLVPFSVKFVVAFFFEATFRRAMNQLCTYHAETLSAKQRRLALNGGNMSGPIQYSKGRGFLSFKGFIRFK